MCVCVCVLCICDKPSVCMCARIRNIRLCELCGWSVVVYVYTLQEETNFLKGNKNKRNRKRGRDQWVGGWCWWWWSRDETRCSSFSTYISCIISLYIYYTCVSMYVCIQRRIVWYNFIEISVRVWLWYAGEHGRMDGQENGYNVI